MKIENKEVSIKIGNKVKTFTNMILNNYLNLFAKSFTQFREKNLPYCLINFTKDNSSINENSTEMEYDLVLETQLNEIKEIVTENSITNQYYYNTVKYGYNWNDFQGKKIKNIGFGTYSIDEDKYTIYAYLNVSNYNIIVQEYQPIYISRIDQIVSDMNFWSNNQKIKTPLHLSRMGLLEIIGNEYLRIQPQLYSIGFGVLPYTMNKEYLAEELNISTSNNIVTINNVIENAYRPNTKYFSKDLLMGADLIMQQPEYPLIIYKYKLYKEKYIDPVEPPIWEDTGMYYTQYKESTKYGKLKLSVKYERSKNGTNRI